MDKKLGLLVVAVIVETNIALADIAPIINANNQAFIEGLLGNSEQHYSANQPGDAGVPLYNAHGTIEAGRLGFVKTLGNIYTKFTLGISSNPVTYSTTTTNNQSITQGNSVLLSFVGQLGYSFFPYQALAMTPYLLAGYSHNQLNTGGYIGVFPFNYNGGTLITQNPTYGIGLLNQWSAKPNWVLSLDAQVSALSQPWVTGYVNNFNNQDMATTTLQRWSLPTSTSWQVGFGSDYRFTQNLHFRTAITYIQNQLDSVTFSSSGVFPSQTNQSWLWSFGLGYNFATTPLDEKDGFIGSTAEGSIYQVNNQASINLGYQNQDFTGGTTFYGYHQTGGVPFVGLVLDKTRNAVFSEVAIKETVGQTTSSGQNTHNTFFDINGKLGYSFASSINTELTPYATLGYHRGLMDILGMQSLSGIINGITQTYYVNGIRETYSHGWYGAGLLAQWNPMPKLVLSADGNIGNIFNPQMQSWVPLGVTVNTSYSLNDQWYQMAGIGADYEFAYHWHAKANLGYWHYSYGPSATNQFGIATLTDTTNQYTASLGVGYAFG